MGPRTRVPSGVLKSVPSSTAAAWSIRTKPPDARNGSFFDRTTSARITSPFATFFVFTARSVAITDATTTLPTFPDGRCLCRRNMLITRISLAPLLSATCNTVRICTIVALYVFVNSSRTNSTECNRAQQNRWSSQRSTVLLKSNFVDFHFAYDTAKQLLICIFAD